LDEIIRTTFFGAVRGDLRRREDGVRAGWARRKPA